MKCLLSVLSLSAACALAHSGNYTKQGNATNDLFPCTLPPAPAPATNVHSLLPGNIDVIASIGDSITAGFGLDSSGIFDLIVEWRGKTWTSGGQAPYPEVVSIASLLAEYNPVIRGASTGNGGPNSDNAGLNVAISGAIAQGMPAQARTLVDRLARYPADAWKLVNLWIGGNDLCAVCNGNVRNQPPAYEEYIRQALQIFSAELTNVFINLIHVVDVGTLKPVAVGAGCVIGRAACSCGTGNADQIERVRVAAEDMHVRTYNLADDFQALYDREGRTDIAVVAQPFFMHSKPLMLPDGQPDLSYFAPDCFHFSGKGHASAAKALWKNMFEPVGQKSEKWVFGTPLTCPAPDAYLRTAKN